MYLLFILIWGVGGSGFATVVSQLFSAICCYIYIKKENSNFTYWKRVVTVYKRFLMASYKYFIPNGISILYYCDWNNHGQIVLNRLGHEAVAGYTAAQKIDQLGILPMMSFGITMATYSAQNYGANYMIAFGKVLEIVLNFLLHLVFA